MCTECCYARIQERAQHVENYRYGTIYVRKIKKDHTEKDIEQVLNDVSIVFLFALVLFHRVRTGPEKLGKSWDFIMAFSRTGKSWKKATGPRKSWKYVKLN